MADPTFKLQAANNISSLFPTYASTNYNYDFTKYIRKGNVSITRGRADVLQDFDVGKLNCQLDNRNGEFTPTNSASPFYPAIVPNQRVQYTVTYKSITYPLYTGFYDTLTPTFPASGYDALVQLNANDALEIFANSDVTAKTLLSNFALPNLGSNYHIPLSNLIQPFTGGSFYVLLASPNNLPFSQMNFTQATGYAIVSMPSATVTPYVTDNGLFSLSDITIPNPYLLGQTLTLASNTYYQERSDQRIKRLLNSIQWIASAGNTNLEVGLTIVPDHAENGALLTALQLVASSENGQFFIAADGKATFHNRNHRFLNSTPKATFGDASGELPYTDIATDYSKQFIKNVADVTRIAGSTQNASDLASIVSYGRRSISKSGQLLTSDAEALNSALFTINKTTQPKIRIPSIQINMRDPRYSDTLIPAICGLEFGDLVTVNKRYGSTTITQPSFVEGITHNIQDQGLIWTVELRLSPAYDATNNYWILGDPVYGVLGSTTRLGY
jgi:hypothetical protein